MNLYVKTPNGEAAVLSRDYEAGSQVLSFPRFIRLMLGYLDYMAEKVEAKERNP